MLRRTYSHISDSGYRTVNNAVITIGNTDDSGKGKHFKSRFIQAGLVKIENQGVVLLKKETIDNSLKSMIGSPVIIKHQDVTNENVDDIRCGVISDAYFNSDDGWYYAEGIIWDEKALGYIQNGWSVSCSYDFTEYDDAGGVENNIKYDKEFTKLNFTHLALVNNPRYERANIVFNSKDENGRWVTIKGTHVFIPDGKTLDDVMEEKGWTTGKKDFGKTMGDLQKLADKTKRAGKETPKERVEKAFGLAKKVTDGGKLTDDEKEWLNDDVKDGDDNMRSYKEVREQAEKQLEYVKEKLKEKNSPERHESLVAGKKYLEDEIAYYKEQEAKEAKENKSVDYLSAYEEDLEDQIPHAKLYDWGYNEDGKIDYACYTTDGYGTVGIGTSDEGIDVQYTPEGKLSEEGIHKTFRSLDDAYGWASEKVAEAKANKETKKPKSEPREIKPHEYKNYNFPDEGVSGPEIDKLAKKYGFDEKNFESIGGSYMGYDSKNGMAYYAMVEDIGDGKYALNFEAVTDDGDGDSEIYEVSSPEEGFKYAGKLKKEYASGDYWPTSKKLKGLFVESSNIKDGYNRKKLDKLLGRHVSSEEIWDVFNKYKDLDVRSGSEKLKRGEYPSADEISDAIQEVSEKLFTGDGSGYTNFDDKIDEILDRYYFDDFVNENMLEDLSTELGTQVTSDDYLDARHGAKYEGSDDSDDFDVKKAGDILRNKKLQKYKTKNTNPKGFESKKESNQSSGDGTEKKKAKKQTKTQLSDNELSTKIKDIAPDSKGWEWEDNKKEITVFFKDPMSKTAEKQWDKLTKKLSSLGIRDVMIARYDVRNEKEQDMALIKELRKLIKRIENQKGEPEMDTKERILSILNEKEVEKEVIEDVKNELDKLEEKEEKEEKEVENKKKVKNEDEEDEKEVEEVKEDVKEDVDNKCKNSKSTFDKINAIYCSVKLVTEDKTYVSRQDKLDNAVEYFS